MIETHGHNVGVKIFRFGRFQMELWFCPKGTIESHSHSMCHSKLWFLWGDILGTIGSKTGLVTKKDMFRTFNIPAGVKHSAVVNSFCVFANFETWDSNPTSAAIDFEA